MKKLPFILVVFLSLPAFGCMNLKALLMLNGEELSLNQKVDLDKTYSFKKNDYVVNVTLPSGQKEGVHYVEINVDRTLNSELRRVSSGRILVEDGNEVLMKTTDDKTKETFEYKITVKNI